ncbi:helix-turn-helix domain-containing protein [Paenibacillus sp. GCM10012303]|uniref:helix-turn-helix domain-containing protein n=1 Tax=Paenibacillus sp. GCM10012303 TaxID=3317340 RepID=UPI003609A81F
MSLIHLMEQAQHGNKDALFEIINNFKPAILKEVRKANPVDKDDLEQEIVIKVINAVLSYKTKPTYTPTSTLN